MLTRSLEQLRDAVRRTADVVNFTDKHPDDYVNDLVNRGLGALSRICRTTNPEFQPIASTTITTDGTNTAFALPTSFRSLISVEYTPGDSSRKIWLNPYDMPERAALTSSTVTSGARHALGYRLLGNNIELLPKPIADDTALIWYATSVTQLASDPATVDVMDRLDDYVIWWAAREIADEREAWERSDRLGQKIASLEGDIRILARSLDLNTPSRITDERNSRRFGWARGGRRYR